MNRQEVFLFLIKIFLFLSLKTDISGFICRMKRYLKAVADIFLPRQCVVCGRMLLLSERQICLHCLEDLPRTFFWNQSHNAMADRFNGRIQEYLCGEDRSATGSSVEPYAYAAALFFFHSEAGYRRIPYQIKYHSNLDAGRYFGRMLGSYLASSPLYHDLDMVLPVPLHWTRKWKRGYNQAEVIAAAAARAMGKPVRPDILFRRRRTKTQTKVGVEDKCRNVEGAFGITDDARSSLAAMSGLRHLLIVDDVFTTGSTLFACFVALRAVFPPSVRISVATLGFVGGR